MFVYLRFLVDKRYVRLEAGDVLAAVLALLLLLGVRLALVVAHLEEVLKSDCAHGAVGIVILSLVSQHRLANRYQYRLLAPTLLIQYKDVCKFDFFQ